MSRPLRVLVVEDSEDDTDLLLRELRRGDYEPTYKRVENAEMMQAALANQTWDIIISDYRMPHFTGLEALVMAQENGHDLPFILISGTIGEDLAVEAMRAGAHDYLMKGQLTRLIPAIERELREAQVRREERQAKAELKRLQQERERYSLEQISRQPKTSVTAEMYGSRPLRKISRANFDNLSKRYGKLIDMALEQRAYKVKYSFSDNLRDLAEEMGAIRVSPRDVVEIHNASLIQNRPGMTEKRAEAYIEEGRLMLLELMGYLVAYYRNYAFGKGYNRGADNSDK